MDDWQKLAYDHEQTTKYFHALADARFKLLALVPLVTGGAFATLNPVTNPGQSCLVGAFGFLVTLGITFYDRRNTQIYDAMNVRAKALEVLMALPRLGNPRFHRSGPFLHRPERSLNLFGVIRIWHDRGLALVYATALAAWAFLAISGAAHYVGIAARQRRFLLVVITLSLWLAFLCDYLRSDTATDASRALPPEIEEIAARAPGMADSDHEGVPPNPYDGNFPSRG